jgi:hypothetical protein
MRRVASKGPLTVRAVRGAGIALAAALALASCASVPERAPSEWLGALPGHATMYVSFNVVSSADLVKKALAEAGEDLKDVGTLLDMTKRLVCSVTLEKGAPARFSVIGLGNYPAGIIGMRLGGNKEWKKVNGAEGRYWQWSKAGIQMSVPNNGILLASNGGIDTLLSDWASPLAVTVPPDVAADMKSADLVVYMPELPGDLAEQAAAKGLRLPIQEVWIDAVKGTGGYDVSGTANTGSEREAKLLTLVVKLGLVAWMKTQDVANTSEKLKAISVTASGVQVKLSGLHLTDEEIVPLLLSLVKGSSTQEPAAATDAGSTGASTGATDAGTTDAVDGSASEDTGTEPVE